MAHRYHPDPNKNDPPDAIYFDKCEDCEHHAKRTPFYQDPEKINKLWNRMIAVELEDSESYRSQNEKIACMELWKTYIFLERFTVQNPRELFAWTRET